MNRENFGRLIAAIRQEQRDENGLPWTQAQLAEEANRVAGAELFTKYIIGSIERGTHLIDAKTLPALATALQLTSGERRELVLAASGIDTSRMARRDNDPEKVLSELMQKMSHIFLPSYIIDPYHDAVAASWAVFKLLELESAGLGPGSQDAQRFGHNIVRVAFSQADQPDSHLYRINGGDSWQDNLNQTIAMFRTVSLRYRGTDYFRELLQELKRHRQFARYWRAAYIDDRDHFVESRKIQYYTEKWGSLSYFFWHHMALTAVGELYLCVYVPATRDTTLTFARIVKQTANLPPIRIPSWPEKRLP
jgi:transcriptional regulator with XRE-family HTH domain